MNRKRQPHWQTPPHNLVLGKDEIHIWRVHLDLPVEQIAQLSQILSEDEQTRAERFRFPQHRQRFIAARGILRQLLGAYLDLPGDRLIFNYSSRGKPSLAPSMERANLEFNLSHSQDLAVYGFTLGRRIGIDLEYLRSTTDVEGIASRFFAAKESEIINNLVGEKQQQAFFQIWTAKEAYLKATGEGIAGSLAAVEVSWSEEFPICLLSFPENTVGGWFLHDFIPATNYVATVAVEGLTEANKIEFWSWYSGSQKN
ncbi:4'-phosphopantetheinyl transferase superfamily protein [Pleurocapsales cyanobacterium LEGE 06147]|nr:4'-phosphopantetheinyl transferase superfamily protein [Pleurocapsales cyanobacterium LEGE 06147]